MPWLALRRRRRSASPEKRLPVINSRSTFFRHEADIGQQPSSCLDVFMVITMEEKAGISRILRRGR